MAVQELRVHESNRGFIAILGNGDEVTWGSLSRRFEEEDFDFDLFD